MNEGRVVRSKKPMGCVCKLCGEAISCDIDENGEYMFSFGGFFDRRLIHSRRVHKDLWGGRGWSILQRIFVW